jgi:hypothetical protein
MNYKTVYELRSSRLNKPTALVSVDKAGVVKRYEALRDGEVFIPKPHLALFTSNPGVAKRECFKSSPYNNLRESLTVHENMPKDDFDKKLAELMSVTEDDMAKAARMI